MATLKTWFELGWQAVCVLAFGLATASVLASGSLPQGRLAGPAPAGYLARWGPVPLRFRAPPPSVASGLTLLAQWRAPSAAATHPPGTTVAAPEAAPPIVPPDLNLFPALLNPATAVQAAAVSPPAIVVSPGAAGSDSLFPLPAPLPAGPAITPQMLLQFFKPVASGTNGPAGVLVPIQFNPPVPLTPPSSRATYKVE